MGIFGLGNQDEIELINLFESVENVNNPMKI